MKKALGIILAASVLGGATAIAHEGHQTDGVVGERTAAMKDMGGAMKHLGAIAKGEKPFDDVAPDAAAKIAEVAAAVPGHFPEGSGPGGDGIGETRAKPEIWSDWQGFLDANAKLEAAAEEIVAAVAAQDQAALGAAMGAAGKACGGCHKPFRTPKD